MAGKVKYFSGADELAPIAPAPHTNAYHQDQTKSIWITGHRWKVDGATDTTMSASPKKIQVAAMADGASQGVFGSFEVPDDIVDSEDIICVPIFAAASTVTGKIRWSVNNRYITPGLTDITLNGTTTDWDGTSAARTQDQAYAEETTQALTGTPSAGDLCRFSLIRLGAHANDTMGIVVNLVAIRFDYTADH